MLQTCLSGELTMRTFHYFFLLEGYNTCLLFLINLRPFGSSDVNYLQQDVYSCIGFLFEYKKLNCLCILLVGLPETKV